MTADQLETLRRRIERGREAPASRPKPSSRPASVPLSFAQERIWLHEQLEPGSIAYNRPTNIRLRGPLRADILQQTFEEVIARHDALRTTVRLKDGVPAVLVQPQVALAMPLLDLAGVPDTEARARKAALEESLRPFDLTIGPLFRCQLLRLAEEDHLLLLTFHHFVFDAWSQAVLLRDLAECYEAICERGHAPGANRCFNMGTSPSGTAASRAWPRWQ